MSFHNLCIILPVYLTEVGYTSKLTKKDLCLNVCLSPVFTEMQWFENGFSRRGGGGGREVLWRRKKGKAVLPNFFFRGVSSLCIIRHRKKFRFSPLDIFYLTKLLMACSPCGELHHSPKPYSTLNKDKYSKSF